MSKLKDLKGQRFGRLVVIERAENFILPSGQPQTAWLCRCDCGNILKTRSFSLTNGTTKSCGCLAKELRVARMKKYNTYDLSGEYGIGYTSKGEEFYFDLEDYDKIKDYCWMINNRGYVSCSVRKNKKAIDILMHKIIMDSPNDEDVDHINGISTRNDNRKSNLRKCTHQMNMCNYSKPKNNTSGVTGVSWDNRYSVWKAYITYRNKRINLGTYNDFKDTVKARLKKKKKYFGDYSAQQHLYEQYGI